MFAGIEPTKLDAEKIALRSEIIHFLQGLNLEEPEVLASLSFTISDKNRIQSVSVDCDDNDMCQLIKNRLIHKKIGVKLSHPDQTYYLNIIFKLE
jgi:hypothetical protein